MEKITIKVRGISPLLMHSDRFANPLDPATKAHKELTGKRKKTDDDHEAIAHSEWKGSLYIDETGPYIPGQNFDASIIAGAKMQKLGSTVKRAVQVLDDRVYLDYPGPKSAEALFVPEYIDVRGVKVGTAKVMRCRPVFREWGAQFSIAYNPEQINLTDLVKAISDAGMLVGVCDYRPRFGKFTVEVV